MLNVRRRLTGDSIQYTPFFQIPKRTLGTASAFKLLIKWTCEITVQASLQHPYLGGQQHLTSSDHLMFSNSEFHPLEMDIQVSDDHCHYFCKMKEFALSGKNKWTCSVFWGSGVEIGVGSRTML